MKKFFLLLLPFAALQAQEPSIDSLSKRLSALESENSSREKRYNLPFSTADGITFSGDALYWQARENGTAYALKNKFAGLGVHDQEQQVKNLDFDWDFGFRAGLGYAFPRDRWRLFSQWTHFNTHAFDLGHGIEPDIFVPIWANPQFAPGMAILPYRVKAHWNLHLDQIDLTLSRPFFAGKYLSLHPVIGPSGLWLKQHYRLQYIMPPFSPGYSKVKMRDEFAAIGLRAGLKALFGFPGGWSFFGDAFFSLYYGEYQLHRSENYTPSATPNTVEHTSVRERWHGVAPLAQMAVGIGYDHAFNDGSYAVSAKLCYEYAIYFSQNQFLRFIDNEGVSAVLPSQGDITIGGGTLSLGFTF